MSTTHFSGPVEATYIAPPTGGVGSGFQTGPQGGLNAWNATMFGTGAIADTTATALFTVTVPNVAASCIFRLLLRTAITTASHIYDSTRVVEQLLAVTRVAGAAVVGVLGAALGGAQATSSGGRTITSTTLTVSAITGGVTATNSFTVSVTNILSTAGVSESQIWVEMMNGVASGITMTQTL